MTLVSGNGGCAEAAFRPQFTEALTSTSKCTDSVASSAHVKKAEVPCGSSEAAVVHDTADSELAIFPADCSPQVLALVPGSISHASSSSLLPFQFIEASTSTSSFRALVVIHHQNSIDSTQL